MKKFIVPFLACLFVMAVGYAVSDHFSALSLLSMAVAPIGSTMWPNFTPGGTVDASMPGAGNQNSQLPMIPCGPSANGFKGAISNSLIIPQFEVNVTCVEDILAINGYPVTKSFTVTVTSDAAVNAVDTEVFLFNETASDLNNQVTDNGSGAGSITYNYPDQLGGRACSRLMSGMRAGVGAAISGVALRILNGQTAAASKLASAQARWLTRTYFRNPLTTDLDMATMQKRPDQDTSIEVIPVKFNVTGTSQFAFIMPANGDAADDDYTANVTVYFA